MIEKLTRQDFEDLPAGSLSLQHQDQTLPLEVVELRDLTPISPRPQPFSVVFAGPASPVLAQGIHTLLHPRHGALDLFIVPVSRDALNTRYEVIFN